MAKGILEELPRPSLQKSGWPWKEETRPSIYQKRIEWPKISIVTPSYNQGQFIEEAIRSVLLQNYPNLEYIIIDGGSTDNTVEIIKKYEHWITYWTSESDDGQADAINKGLLLSTGNIFNWLNSDDFLAQSALYHIALAFEKNIDILAGNVANFIDRKNIYFIHRQKGITYDKMLTGFGRANFHQPGVWLRTKNMQIIGQFNKKYHFCFDGEFYIKYLYRFSKIKYLNKQLVYFRIHKDAKTTAYAKKMNEEFNGIRKELISNHYPQVRYCFRREINKKTWIKVINLIVDSRKSKIQKTTTLIAYLFSRKYASINRFFMSSLLKRVIFKWR